MLVKEEWPEQTSWHSALRQPDEPTLNPPKLTVKGPSFPACCHKGALPSRETSLRQINSQGKPVNDSLARPRVGVTTLTKAIPWKMRN